MSEQDRWIRRRNAFDAIIGRRQAYFDKFFGVGEQPYGTQKVNDAEFAEFQAWKAAQDTAKLINGQG